jgi:spore coat protein H
MVTVPLLVLDVPNDSWHVLRIHGRLLALALAGCIADGDELPTPVPPPQPQAVAEGRCPEQPALDAELPVWDLYVPREDWDALHVEVRAKLRVDALLCLGREPYPLGLELQGASTRKLRKKSFDLKFGAEQPLDAAPFGEAEQLPRVLLKAMLADQSLIREALAFELWRMLGYDAPRLAFVNLRINGADWGLYTVVEPVDEQFLARRGYPAGGRLYKGVREEGSRADFRPGRNLRNAFESKTEGPGEWEDLEALVDVLQNTPLTQAAFEREVDPIFPLAAYFDRMIWIAITQNSDAVGQNFYLYNAPRDGHDYWTMLPWDSNVCCGADWKGHYALIGSDEQPMVDGGNYLGNRLVQLGALRRRYLARFRQVLAEELSEEAIMGAYAPLAAQVERDLARDQVRWKREVSPAQAFAGLERFFRERPAALYAAMQELERKHGDEPADQAEDEPSERARDAGAEAKLKAGPE